MTESKRKELDEFCKDLDEMQKLKNKGKKPKRGAFAFPIWKLKNL